MCGTGVGRGPAGRAARWCRPQETAPVGIGASKILSDPLHTSWPAAEDGYSVVFDDEDIGQAFATGSGPGARCGARPRPRTMPAHGVRPGEETSFTVAPQAAAHRARSTVSV
ncbi:hypothetical protein RKD28_007007 [Streptomyces sp. SAI-229]|jgi:hypothetical protein